MYVGRQGIRNHSTRDQKRQGIIPSSLLWFFRHYRLLDHKERSSNQWSESAGGAAAKSWSQQGPRDEYKESFRRPAVTTE
uniref:Uncharacterized protein n=1 Tax=Parascaris univalens TaxID=6257 RepID=A0A915C9E8_PARUN